VYLYLCIKIVRKEREREEPWKMRLSRCCDCRRGFPACARYLERASTINSVDAARFICIQKFAGVCDISDLHAFKRADLIRQIETFVVRVTIRFTLSIPVLHNWHVSAIRIRRIYPRAIIDGALERKILRTNGETAFSLSRESFPSSWQTFVADGCVVV